MRSQVPPVTEDHRKLVIALAGGDYRTLTLIHSMEHLRSRDMIYSWLIRNQITGEKLFNFFEEHGFSWNQVAKEVISRIRKTRKTPLIVGKDTF